MPGKVHITDEHGRGFGTTDSSGNPAVSTVTEVLSGSITPEHIGDGGTFTLVAGSPRTASGLSVYGLPYNSVTFTKTGSNGTMSITWSVNTSGVFHFDVTMNAADSLAVTGTNCNDDDMQNNLLYVDSAGAVDNAAITGATAFTGALFVAGGA